MKNYPSLKIERKPTTQERTGWARSTLHSRIKQGLFVPPISLGARAVGFLEHETTSILAAMVAGQSKDEIKELVVSLVNQRKGMMENLS